MKRYDLRPLKDKFYDRMLELMDTDIKDKENAIFLFEIGDFTPIQKVSDLAHEHNYTVMNSLKFNEVDWTVVIKKEPDLEKIEKVKKELEEKATAANKDDEE